VPRQLRSSRAGTLEPEYGAAPVASATYSPKRIGFVARQHDVRTLAERRGSARRTGGGISRLTLVCYDKAAGDVNSRVAGGGNSIQAAEAIDQRVDLVEFPGGIVATSVSRMLLFPVRVDEI
jgi:hypothetical protein